KDKVFFPNRENNLHFRSFYQNFTLPLQRKKLLFTKFSKIWTIIRRTVTNLRPEDKATETANPLGICQLSIINCQLSIVN
ncbi:MAG: hypothetical protein IKS72_02325, partial [Prevotella sp.]|nr:hypothetical protein [Prevotella sp.]